MSKKYTFREITEKDELEKFFRLRYDVYSNCRMKPFIKSNENSIDIDYYDVHSRHYALTCENLKVGYLRVVLPKEELTQNIVITLAEKYNLFNDFESYLISESAPFPFLYYKGVPTSYWNYYKKVIQRNESLAEASRLVLHQEYRTIRLSKFLIECAIVLHITICLGRKHAVLTCYDGHVKFYEHYGFKTIGSEKGYISCGQSRVAMALSTLPEQLHSKLEDMKNEFKTTNKIIKTL